MIGAGAHHVMQPFNAPGSEENQLRHFAGIGLRPQAQEICILRIVDGQLTAVNLAGGLVLNFYGNKIRGYFKNLIVFHTYTTTNSSPIIDISLSPASPQFKFQRITSRRNQAALFVNSNS